MNEKRWTPLPAGGWLGLSGRRVDRGTGAKNLTIRVTRGTRSLPGLFSVRPPSLRLVLAAIPDLPRLGHETQPRAGFKDAVEEGRVAVRDRRGCGARERAKRVREAWWQRRMSEVGTSEGVARRRSESKHRQWRVMLPNTRNTTTLFFVHGQ